MMLRRTLLLLCAGLLALGGCSNPFAPKKHTPEGGGEQPPAPPATTPEIFFDNLHRAMRDRDKDLYETLLDDNFWFTETNCQGELVYYNGREEELAFIGGTRDGSKPGVFDRFRTFDFEFTLNRRDVELGRDYPKADEDDPDGHPDEDWQFFRGRVQMLMTDENGDGYRVDQGMTFKLRQGAEGLWKLIRWIDDPLSGDCSTDESGKPVAEWVGWGKVKQGR